MSPAAPPISNSEMAESANARQFEQIKALAATFAKRDVSAKDALYAALEALFHFVMNLETEAERREFVELHGGKWGKVAQDNPFQPFVKLAFNGEGISEGSRSQYAKVLRYAEFQRDKSKTLADWLKSSGGIEGLYGAANSFFLSQTQYVDQQRFADALTEVKQRKRSDAFTLDRAAVLGDEIDQGYVMAILHVDQDGNAHVVEYSERDQGKIAAIMEKIASVEAKEPTRAVKPLFPMFRAIRLLKAVAPVGKNDDDRLITLSTETGTDGKSHVVVRAISSHYEGALGEVALADPVAWVPSDRSVALGQADADRLCDGFELEGHWLCDASSGPLILAHSGKAAPSVALLDALPDHAYYRARQDFQRIVPIMLSRDAAESFLKQRNRQSAGKAYRGALRLDWEDGHLSYRPNPNGPVRHVLFSLPTDPSFGDDRMFDSDLLAALCTAACDLRSDLKGWLVSTPEEDNCAILIDHVMDRDRASIVAPLVKTMQGHTTQTNIALA